MHVSALRCQTAFVRKTAKALYPAEARARCAGFIRSHRRSISDFGQAFTADGAELLKTDVIIAMVSGGRRRSSVHRSSGRRSPRSPHDPAVSKIQISRSMTTKTSHDYDFAVLSEIIFSEVSGSPARPIVTVRRDISRSVPPTNSRNLRNRCRRSPHRLFITGVAAPVSHRPFCRLLCRGEPQSCLN